MVFLECYHKSNISLSPASKFFCYQRFSVRRDTIITVRPVSRWTQLLLTFWQTLRQRLHKNPYHCNSQKAIFPVILCPPSGEINRTQLGHMIIILSTIIDTVYILPLDEFRNQYVHFEKLDQTFCIWYCYIIYVASNILFDKIKRN